MPRRCRAASPTSCLSRWTDALATYSSVLELELDDEQRTAADEGVALARARRLPEPPAQSAEDIWQELLAAG